MGWQRPILQLSFKDPELEGLEVYAHRLTMGQMSGGETDDNGDSLYRNVGQALVRWNMEDKFGKPVPPTEEGLRAEGDVPLLTAIFNALVDASVKVPLPLSRPSSSGSGFLEGSLPMETLSPNLMSSPEPS